MENEKASHYAGLRGHLYAGDGVWVGPLDDVLERLSPDILDQGWSVNDSIYEEGQTIAASNDSYGRFGRKSDSEFVQFSFSPDDVDLGTWAKKTSHFWVGYDAE